MTLQLGTLHLDLASGPSGPQNSAWLPLHSNHLREIDIAEDSRKLCQALVYLLDDSGLGFTGAYKVDEAGMTIRASILPSDAKGSVWKRTSLKSKDREVHLRTMTWHLQAGWQGDGEYIQTRTVSPRSSRCEKTVKLI
jgi:hypothetical protein